MSRDKIPEGLYISNTITIKRITALWALSETTFGGLLHALHIPFTGIFIGGSAVIFITLIAYVSDQKYSIIKATLIVLILKGVVSPYTPVTAYFSVLLQGVLGEILFAGKKRIPVSAFILSVSSMLVFGFQKIIILTIVFGQNLWQSIDSYAAYLLSQFYAEGQNSLTVHLSLVLISIYVLIHLAAGIFIGIVAARIPGWITSSVTKNHYFVDDIEPKMNSLPFFEKKKSRKWSGSKKRSVFFILAGTAAMISSYLLPGFKSGLFYDLLIMSIRAIIITIIWYFFLAPLVINYTKLYLKKRQNQYTGDVEEIIFLFPRLKNIISTCWTKSSEHKGLRKYRLFLSYSLITMLFAKFNLE